MPKLSAVSRGQVVTFHDSPYPRTPVKRCNVCGGMPWARTPDRLDTPRENCAPRPVLGPDGRCRGCGGDYAPEPERTR